MALPAEFATHVRQAVSRPGLQRVFVFGSYARREQDAYSDLDLVVVCETGRPFLERVRDFEAPIGELAIPFRVSE